MRGPYENEWKKAFDGKAIPPSEALWDNIAAAMDERYGKRNWVTIFLVAATISVAFAFPLTIGNSSFEVRPDAILLTDAANEPQILPEQESLGTQPLDTDYYTNTAISKVYQLEEQKELAQISQYASPEPASIEIISAESKGLTIYDRDDELAKPYAFVEYDLIPFFIPLDKDMERGVLAAASLGSGNRVISSGASSMDFASAQADAELAGFNNREALQRSEEGGITYSLGLGAEFPLGRKWSLQSGLGYMVQRAPGISNVVFDDNGTYIPLGTYSTLEPGVVFLSSTYNYTAINNYLNVPVIMKYPIINKQIQLRAGGGISTDFMLSNSISAAEYADAKNKVKDTLYNPFGLSGVINLDLKFNLQGSYALALETGVRKGFTPINSSGSKYPASFNVGVILFYQLD